MLLRNLYKTFPNSGRLGVSRRLKDPLYTLLLQLAINLFFVPTRNRLSQLSVGSYKVSAPVRPNLFRWSSSAYELARIIIKSSVSSEGVASKYTARVVRHANKHGHRFAVPRTHLTVNGPNKSTPVNVNGGLHASSLALGSDPINCSKG